MSEQANTKKQGWKPRRKYLLDARSQLGVTAQVLGVLTVICLVYAGGVLLFTRDRPLFELGPGQMKSFVMVVIGAYMVISALIFGLLAITLTHRFVGPAFVIGRAIDDMLEGKYDSRLTLRRSDHLKKLAAAVERLRTSIRTDETLRAQAVADLESCLAENDLAGAREILARLKPAMREPAAGEPTASDAGPVPAESASVS